MKGGLRFYLAEAVAFMRYSVESDWGMEEIGSRSGECHKMKKNIAFFTL